MEKHGDLTRETMHGAGGKEREREMGRKTIVIINIQDELYSFLRRTLPAVFFDHVCHFNYVLALLVLLARFERVFVFPAQGGLTAFTIYIGDCMQSGQQNPFFCRATTNVYNRIEKVCSSLTALKRLGYKFIVICQVCSAVNARICPVAVRQIRLKRLDHDALVSGTRLRVET